MDRRMAMDYAFAILVCCISLTTSDNLSQPNRSQRLAERDLSGEHGQSSVPNKAEFGSRSLPLRSAVESVPPKLLRDAEPSIRQPLRDAVERRPPAYDDDLYALTDELESLGIDPWAYTEQERKSAPEKYQSAQEYPESEHHYFIERLKKQKSNSNLGYYGAAKDHNQNSDYSAFVPASESSQTIHKENQSQKSLRTAPWMISSSKSFRERPQIRQSPLVVCFVEGWAAYRMEPLSFSPGMLPTDLCTNVLYAFATLDPDTYKIVPTNEEYDIIKGGYKTVTGLKREQPSLKVSISVGGAGGARWLSAMAAAPQTRKAFVSSALQFVREHGFDGIDLHWQYPGDEEVGGNADDKEHLTYLLKELKAAFETYNLLVSMAVAANRYRIEDGYDVAAISSLVDFVTLQAWDLHQDTELCDAADHHSPISSRPHDHHSHIFDNVEYGVQYWLRHGMARQKLVLGVPFFGRSYTLVAKNITAPGSPASDLGRQGKYTQTKGLLAYFEICMALHQTNAKADNDAVGSPYAVFDDQWVGYDNVDSIKQKMMYALEMGLAGAAAWTADMDDFRGLCGDRWPLLTVMANTLKGKPADAIGDAIRPSGSCLPGEEVLISDPDNCSAFYLCRGGFKYHLACEEGMLFDPLSGLCRFKDIVTCFHGESFKIYISTSLEEVKPGVIHPGNDIIPLPGQLNFNAAKNPLEDKIGGSDDNGATIMTKDPESAKIKATPNEKIVVCYMTNWAFYRRGEAKFAPENIDTTLCTHVVYAYATLDPETLLAKEFDPWTDIDNDLYNRVSSLKGVIPMLGLGGWTDSSGDKYSRLVSSGTSRRTFVTQLIALLRRYNFQGVHFDWNYPVCWQSDCKKGPPSDKANLAKLAQELSEELKKQNPPMTLGLAISGYKEVIEVAYDLPLLSQSANFLSAMTYDYHGGWERSTAHGSPLFAQPGDALPQYTVEYTIKYLLEKGAEPKKLLLGLAFYGQSYRLQVSALRAPKPLKGTSSSGGPGSPAAGPGDAGESTKQPGMLSYSEICYRVKNLRWTKGQINGAGPFAYHRDQWVGYEDPHSIAEKINWSQGLNLGGVVAWTVDLDDFTNRCCQGTFPLLQAANKALHRLTESTLSAADPCQKPAEPVTPVAPVLTPSPELGITTSTTPSTTTVWWLPANTTTTTASPKPTHWTPPPTTAKPTTVVTQPPVVVLPSKPPKEETVTCVSGSYSAVPGECGFYYQCVSGQQKKQPCAPGLHWSAKNGRCDWPANAKCESGPDMLDISTARVTEIPVTKPPKSSTPRPTPSTPIMTVLTTKASSHLTAGLPTTEKSTSAPIQVTTSTAPVTSHPIITVTRPTRPATWKPVTAWPTRKKPVTLRPVTTPIPTTTEGKEHVDVESSIPGSVTIPVTSPAAVPIVVSTLPPVTLAPVTLAPTTLVPSTLPFTTTAHTYAPTHRPVTWKPAKVSTKRPVTTPKPVISSSEVEEETGSVLKPGMPCHSGSYHAHPRCEMFFMCVNGHLVAQSCAPGLAWHNRNKICAHKSTVDCSKNSAAAMEVLRPPKNKPQAIPLSERCESGSYTAFTGDCQRYQHCMWGKYEIFECAHGLHWNQEKKVCDWPANAKCSFTTTEDTIEVAAEPLPAKPITPILRPTTAIFVPVTDTTPVEATTVAATTNEPIIPVDPPSKYYKVVCYFTNWAWYRRGIGKFLPEDIDASLCTHIVYGFAVLDSEQLVIKAHDSWADFDNKFYERVVAYKKKGIKVSLALGGWNDSAGDKYSRLVNNPSARARFINHAIGLLEKYDFDGLDMDWEYPKCWQVECKKGPASDKAAFAALLTELSAAFKPRGLLLSSAVSPSKTVMDAGYDIPTLANTLDWIAVMTYDYHGQWDKKTGHVAPLYYHVDDDVTFFNANYTIHYWIECGAPASKLVMGMPLYGQSFTLGTSWDTPVELLAKKNGTDLNIPARSGGQAGEYTRAQGFLSYYEICDRVKNHGWKVVQDPLGRMGPYAFKGNQWVSFDDAAMIRKKSQYIRALNLAGAMIWALDLDDFKNSCGEGKYPLLSTIRDVLKDEPNVNDLNMLSEIIPSPESSGKDAKPLVEPNILPDVPEKNEENAALSSEYKVVCYFTNWAWYRPGAGKYLPSDINSSLCTHIVYGFAVLDPQKLVIVPHDSWADIDNKFYEKVTALRARGLKVLIAIGGWNDSLGDKYSRLVNDPAARRRFILHILDFLAKYDFDGLDLDWEYPKCWQVDCNKGPASDKESFAELVKELHSSFRPHGYLLSSAVSPSKRVMDAGYDIPTLSKMLDWIAVMTYDYHGQWDKVTGHVAPMYEYPNDTEKTFNANFTINYWISQGADRKKLVMGMPMYGQSFSLADKNENGLNAATYGGGEAGDFTRARGFLSFYEICDRTKNRAWNIVRDPLGRIGPYATHGDQWVSFDDDNMIRAKSEYIKSMGLGGGMIWALDLDDFHGLSCGCGQYPLLRVINSVLRGGDLPPKCELGSLIIAPTQAPTAKPTTNTTIGTLIDQSDTIITNADSSANTTENEISWGGASGAPCAGRTFAPSANDCNKYFVCNQGSLLLLNCPPGLHWNEDHCDWPASAQCKEKRKRAQSHGRITEPEAVGDSRFVCYFTSWASYRSGDGQYTPQDIDASQCTHLVYAYADLDPDTLTIVPHDVWTDIELDFYGKITSLRSKGVKVSIALGGWNESAKDKFGKMASNETSRNRFIQSALAFLEKWNFDGLEISWQYPVCPQGICEMWLLDEKDRFSDLIVDLSLAFHKKGYLLSAVVAPFSDIIDNAYDVGILATSLDWISVAAYDYYGYWDNLTNFAVPLYHNYNEPDDKINVNYTLHYWLSAGMPAEKIVLGVPLYGQSYTLQMETDDIGIIELPVAGPGKPGNFTRVPGFLAFYEICLAVKNGVWSVARDMGGGAVAGRGDQWLSFSDSDVVWSAGALARYLGLGGVSAWAIDLDDFRNTCECGRNVLLNSLHYGLKGLPMMEKKCP